MHPSYENNISFKEHYLMIYKIEFIVQNHHQHPTNRNCNKYVETYQLDD